MHKRKNRGVGERRGYCERHESDVVAVSWVFSDLNITFFFFFFGFSWWPKEPSAWHLFWAATEIDW